MMSDVENEARPCAVCPMAIARGAWQQVPPETADHLLGAAAGILAALRTLIVAGEQLIDLQRQRVSPSTTSPAGDGSDDGSGRDHGSASAGPATGPAATTPTGSRRLRRIDIA